MQATRGRAVRPRPCEPAPPAGCAGCRQRQCFPATRDVRARGRRARPEVVAPRIRPRRPTQRRATARRRLRRAAVARRSSARRTFSTATPTACGSGEGPSSSSRTSARESARLCAGTSASSASREDGIEQVAESRERQLGLALRRNRAQDPQTSFLRVRHAGRPERRLAHARVALEEERRCAFGDPDEEVPEGGELGFPPYDRSRHCALIVRRVRRCAYGVSESKASGPWRCLGVALPQLLTISPSVSYRSGRYCAREARPFPGRRGRGAGTPVRVGGCGRHPACAAGSPTAAGPTTGSRRTSSRSSRSSASTCSACT